MRAVCRGVRSCSPLEKMSPRRLSEELFGRPYSTLHIYISAPVKRSRHVSGGQGTGVTHSVCAYRRRLRGCWESQPTGSRAVSVGSEGRREMESIKATIGNRFMDVQEAAQFLGVSPKSLYSWVSQRRVPYRKAGRRLLFFESELIEWTRPKPDRRTRYARD